MSATIPGPVGPGTQPGDEDGAELSYMEMPKGMRTYSAPSMPEPDEVEDIASALAVLHAVSAALARGQAGSFDLTALNSANRDFVDQLLGEGEVSVIAGSAVQAQESVLAGVWRVHEVDADGQLMRDTIEVGTFPRAVLSIAAAAARPSLSRHDGALPADVYNAPALVTEIEDRLAAFEPGAPAHVINLSLLPLTEGDVAFLDSRLTKGPVTVLSRGYGNCRITSTGTCNAWWVQYFNSREVLILNTIEVTDVPSVACAAPEDLEDSAQRLAEILEVYR
ncbi:MAG: hydrogenase expression/formation protein [Hyphomicrobiaceae bacterium]|nr:MAG: hydrogenase expression/formation protein [Hyphomicrobiaceae bacterium]